MKDNSKPKYPLLQEILTIKGLPMQATFTNRDAAKVFGVSIRAIQARIAQGKLIARDLPGRARFLPIDLEEYIANSRKDGRGDSSFAAA